MRSGNEDFDEENSSFCTTFWRLQLESALTDREHNFVEVDTLAFVHAVRRFFWTPRRRDCSLNLRVKESETRD